MIVSRAFVSPVEIAELRRLDGDWLPGRQGTGYDKLPLRPHLDAHPVVARALAQIGPPIVWDAYVIRYPDGAYVPPHVDPAERGVHRRLNILLVTCALGGELWIGGRHVELAVGDAVLFEPDRELHEVTRVVGERVVFSVGAWISDADAKITPLTV